MLDDVLMMDFINGFLSYGSYSPSIVFIGMEEGGGNCFEEVDARLRAWSDLARPQLVDVREYHEMFGRYESFTNGPGYKRQATWQGLIKVCRAAMGIEIPDLNAYQRADWCRPDGDVAAIELFPLPSPSIGHWGYCQWTRVPQIKAGRDSYYHYVFDLRAAVIRDFIARTAPEFVVAYGLGHRCWFEKLFGSAFVDTAQRHVFALESATPYSAILIKHSAYASNAALQFAGNYLRQKSQKQG